MRKLNHIGTSVLQGEFTTSTEKAGDPFFTFSHFPLLEHYLSSGVTFENIDSLHKVLEMHAKQNLDQLVFCSGTKNN